MHQLVRYKKTQNPYLFVVPVVSLWFELSFLGSVRRGLIFQRFADPFAFGLEQVAQEEATAV